jgi:hypothetical protein
MSFLRAVTIETDFIGVTENKGEIIVNDGIKNTAQAIGTDGYVLTADSTQATGIKWAPSTGSASVSATQKILAATFSTNITTPIELTDFTFTPTTGTYLIMVNLTYAISQQSRTMTIGIYKNNTLITDAARTLQNAGSNMRLSFTMQICSAASGTDVFSIKVNSSNNSSTVQVFDGTTTYLKISSCIVTAASSTITTNSTNPFEITDLGSTPPVGSYYIMCNFLYGMSRINQTFTTGLYKSNSLISGTDRIIQTTPGLREVFQVNFVTTFDGSQAFQVKVNVSNSNTTLTIYDRNIIMVPLI